MAVLTGKAQRSGSSRPVNPSITRLATCPGAGALSQLSTGATSQASGLSWPPFRRYRTYWTASRQTVPTTPARTPPATAANGVIECVRVRIAGSNRRASGSAEAAAGPGHRHEPVRDAGGCADLRVGGHVAQGGRLVRAAARRADRTHR